MQVPGTKALRLPPGRFLPPVGQAAAAPARPAASRNELYERLVARCVGIYEARRRRTAHDLWSMLDVALEQLAVQSPLAHDEASLLRSCVARDLAHMASILVRGAPEDRAALGRLSEQPGAVRLLLKALRLSGDAIFRIAGESASAELRLAGEATCAGTLQCRCCGRQRRSTQALVAVACAGCGGGEFAKSLRV